MHVLVADNDPVGRRMVCKILDAFSGHDVVGEADNLSAAAGAAANAQVDAIVLANTLLDDGRSDVGWLVSETALATIVIGLSGTGPTVWHALIGGASGYLLKDRLINDLPQALVAAEAGGVFVSPPLVRQMIGYLAKRMDGDTSGMTAADIARLLLPRERETLHLLAAGASTEEIAATMSVTTATVRAYVSRILRKLELRSRGEAIALAYRSRFYSPATG